LVSDEKQRPPAELAQQLPKSVNRRSMLATGGAVGVSAAMLVVSGRASHSPAESQQAVETRADIKRGIAAQAAGVPGRAGSPPEQGGTGTLLGPTAAVPVGGGKVYPAQKVVVTQPTAGTFHGFSAICTHKGCTVSSVSGGTINCPCHGSKFKITDGSVAHGPAQRPLPSRRVTAQGGQLRLA
jgi:Rieske Fe-S protein